ncbi:hypothetical protein JCM39194_02260 [Desulfotomaculum varum]
MLAVSFFFALAGCIMFVTGVVGLLINRLTGQYWHIKKWLVLTGSGFLGIILSMLMAMT